MDRQDFDALVNLAMEQPGRAAMRPVVEKELLHYDIFHALDKGNFLKDLVFQGGTSLRLCRGSSRFSEDLDFAGGRDFAAENMRDIKACIEKHIGARYGLKVEVSPPKHTDYIALKVDKWQMTVETAPAQRHLPRQRIKIKIANIPAYTRELMPLRLNYDFLQGYNAVLVNTETISEVMADKILAFPASKNIRYRDIWDLAWLDQQGATLDPKLVDLKIADYQVSGYPALLDLAMKNLPTIVQSKEFRDQMWRFIDAQRIAETLDKPQFLDYLVSTIGRLFAAMQKHLSSTPTDEQSKFRM